MLIQRRRISELKSDPNNARLHAERNIDAIKASLLAFGQQKPIVISVDGVVIAGNGTLEAAKRLEWEEIDVTVSDLEGVKAMAFAIADNRTAELAEWSKSSLAAALSAITEGGIDSNVVGFTGAELRIITEERTSFANVSPSDGSSGTAQGLRYQVVIDCSDEHDQAKMIEEFEEKGRICRPLIL